MTTSAASRFQICRSPVVLFLVSLVHHCESFVPPIGVNVVDDLRGDLRPLTLLRDGDTDGRRLGVDDVVNPTATQVVDRRRALFSAVSTTTAAVAVLGNTAAFAASDAPKAKALSEEYRQGTAVLGSTDEDAVIPKEAYKKLPSGVVYADTRPGTGPDVAGEGKRANVQWVLRKSNGYFVDSSAVDDGKPFVWRIGDRAAAIAGVDEGVRGMRVGGTRRLLIPPSQAYVEGLDDGKPGPLPVGFGPRQQMRRVQNIRKDVPGEYIYLEIQLTRLRD